jgi:glycine cleavage system H protein
MNFPEDLLYTPEHEWVRIQDGTAIVGITDFAQKELGDIVFVEIETLDEVLSKDEVFGTVEAVKTVSDLFIPFNGQIIEVNELVEDEPELVNTDPYGDGWMIKVEVEDESQLNDLLSSEDYKKLIGL